MIQCLINLISNLNPCILSCDNWCQKYDGCTVGMGQMLEHPLTEMMTRKEERRDAMEPVKKRMEANQQQMRGKIRACQEKMETVVKAIQSKLEATINK